MKYSITKWTIKRLYSAFKTGKLNLSPPYQRNFIWSTKDQQILINSINNNIPIPNFFILEKKDKTFEMVDGQQRSRTIISFIEKGFKGIDGKLYSDESHKSFKSFQFPITIIHDLEGANIEKFYALVNKTGIHVNKPEVRKADFYSTRLLKLVDEISELKKFKSLRLFTDTTLKRMNDREFVSELLVLLKDGHVDKKGAIDDYFEKDIDVEIYSELKSKFNSILDKIFLLNSYFPLSNTRYKQRNDFYTLFDFIKSYEPYNEAELVYFYKLLVLIGGDIKPTQEDCEPLKDYAINCVTQSNSKLARANRLSFFNKLLLNTTDKPLELHKKIMSFYNFDNQQLKKANIYYTLSIRELSNKKKIEFLK